MSHQRQTQWSRRLQQLNALRERYMRVGRYDRAHKAYLAAQHVYERWADEVFATPRTQ
jgi:lipopolysaccharide biosynthesis regulator YciM